LGKKKVENLKTPRNTASFVIPQESLDELKQTFEDKNLEKKITPEIKAVIDDLQNALPWIKKFSISTERIQSVLDRTINLPRKSLHPFLVAFLKGLGATDETIKNSHLDEKSADSGVYMGLGDFIALSIDPEERGEEENKLTIAEEILHFLQPFNPRQIDEIGEDNAMMVNHLNEGIALYYKEKTYPDFEFFEQIKNPSNRRDAGVTHYLVFQVWKIWVEEYGEDRMAACFFGKRKFPRKVMQAIENGLTSEFIQATRRMLN
jgi:hypothetical protein